MLYINKDIHERLDYLFVRDVEEDITSVQCFLDPLSTITVDSCIVPDQPVTDTQGNEYPAKRTILLWVSGGVSGNVSKLRIQYSTEGGRTLDEEIVFRLSEDGC
jgi:hypothetical protein